jgi:type I restriction enzyme S subunit
MTALLTDNLPLLAGAPNGIKKLRELILELAVRGKLVSQDPNDESASELLKRISEEKTQLVADSKIKTLKLIEELPNADDLPNLPSSWRWVRFGEIAQHNSGKTLDKGRNTGISRDYITTSNLYWGRFELDNVKQMLIREDELDKCTATKNDLLICEGGEAGRAAVWEQDKEICFQNHVHRARFYGDVSPHYVQRFFEKINASGEINQYRKGIGISNMSSKALASITLPLPPIAEQHRIVDKVNELMAFCDRLETQQNGAETAHSRLVQALLDSLVQSSSATVFADSWGRLAEHFPTLFTSETSIDALKQTLLNLAVMGKLVPQVASDEPASELLKRISEEKAMLITDGKLRKQRSSAKITEAEKTFEIPENWDWVRLEEIAQVGTGATPLRTSPKYFTPATINWVTSGETSQDYINESVQKVAPLALTETNLTVYPPHTLIIAMYGQGKTRGQISELLIDACTNQACAAIQLFDKDESHRRFVKYFFVKSYDDIRLLAAGGAQPNLNLGKIKETVLPLPPVFEQRRIVAKVDQLMILCDQLKARLTQARQLNEQLASTLIERTLTEDSLQAPMATDRQIARTLLAAEITHRLHNQRTFGQRKLQKVIYLAEHAARLAAIQGSYLRDVAGPHDRQLMNKVESEMQNHQWYKRIERETVGHAYRPLSQAGQHRQAYSSAWPVAERVTIEQVIELMRDWDTDRCEMTVTLYAAWNDFILEGRPISDEAIVDEVMHSWNDTKLRFGKNEWLAILAEMKKHKILTPSGFGKRTTGGMLSLPGFE